MCEICLHSPCHSRCPNAPGPTPVFICSGCGREMFEGDAYWDVLGEQFCSECIDDARRIAEHEDVAD